MTGLDAPVVTDPAALREVVGQLVCASVYAVDTEFHRERTYWPRPALVQLAWPGGVAVVDPLAVDLRPLAEVLDRPATAVLHAAAQDLEVLDRACGAVPVTVFDTQVAAGFVGFATPSLAVLVDRVLGAHLPKAERLTDWLRRPLRPDQLAYAAADVAYLLALHETLVAELDRTGRLAWVLEECADLRRRAVSRPDPEEAWLRMKEARGLRGRGRAVAQEVAAWRERQAARLDVPARRVLSDLAVVAIAGARPRTVAELHQVRGVDERHVRGKAAEELLAAVERGLELPAEALRLPRGDDVERGQRPAMALVSSWIAQLGRDLAIEPSLLATRADVAALLSGDDGSRLTTGWRGQLLHEPLRRLLHGEAALSFAGDGSLVLEARSHQPLVVDLPRPTAPWVASRPGR